MSVDKDQSISFGRRGKVASMTCTSVSSSSTKDVMKVIIVVYDALRNIVTERLGFRYEITGS